MFNHLVVTAVGYGCLPSIPPSAENLFFLLESQYWSFSSTVCVDVGVWSGQGKQASLTLCYWKVSDTTN